MIELTSSGKMYLTGRGNVYIIDLRFNNLPQERKEFMKELALGEKVSVDGIVGDVKGVEAFATGEGYMHSKIGLLLKETD